MKKLITISFAAAFLLVQSYVELNAQGVGDDIVKLYIGSDYQKVIEIQKSKKTGDLTAADWYYLGLSYLQIKNIKEAVNAFERCVKIDSANIAYRLNYSRALNQLGRTEDAIKNYDIIVEKDSSNIAALYDVGLILINRKDFVSALPIFAKLCDFNRSDFLSAYYLALSVYQTAETPEDTLRVNDLIFKSRLLNFEYIPSAELAGVFDLNRNYFENAYVSYSLLTILNPANAEYFYRAGFCFEKMKNYDGAIGLFNKAIKRDSTVANYYSHLGYSFFMVGEFNSSLAAYKYAAVMDPENPASYLNLGLVYEKLDSLEAAKNAYERSLQFYPYSKIIFATEQLEAINYRLKNFEQTQVLCEQALTLAPNSIESLFYLACSLDALGKSNKAVEIYKKAAALLENDEKYKTELEHVNKRIEEIAIKVKEKNFWEGKIDGQ